MMDRMKTWLLGLLVIASVLLTWQLWTFQPQYDLLSPTEFVEREGLSDRKEFKALVVPESIVHHDAEEGTSISFPNMFSYNVIMGQMENWTIQDVSQVSGANVQDLLEQLTMKNGIELNYPVNLPADVLQEMMDIDMNVQLWPTINRIWLYDTEEQNVVRIAFISDAQQQLWQGDTDISLTDLHMYRASAQDRHPMTAYSLTDEQDEQWPTRHYLPDEPVQVSFYRYLYQPIPQDLVISYLFADPNLVRQIEERGSQRFYTDGTRGLQQDAEQMIMHFFHPQQEVTNDTLSKDLLQRGISYVNQHKGWDTMYRLDHIEDTQLDRPLIVQYRQMLADRQMYYPIYHSENESDQHLISLEMNENQVVGYKRPLYEIDQPIEKRARMLASGDELMNWILEQDIDVTRIHHMKIGYQSVIRSHYIEYMPHWIIKYADGSVQFVNLITTMSDDNGGSS